MITKTFVVLTQNKDDDGDIIFLDGVVFPETLHFIKDFDATKIMGTVTSHEIKDGKLFVTADFKEDPAGLYPCIGYGITKASVIKASGSRIEGINLFSIGLVTGGNADPKIEPIK